MVEQLIASKDRFFCIYLVIDFQRNNLSQANLIYNKVLIRYMSFIWNISEYLYLTKYLKNIQF